MVRVEVLCSQVNVKSFLLEIYMDERLIFLQLMFGFKGHGLHNALNFF